MKKDQEKDDHPRSTKRSGEDQKNHAQSWKDKAQDHRFCPAQMVGDIAEGDGSPEPEDTDQPRHGGPVNFGKADVDQVGNQVDTDGVDAVGSEEPQGE